MKISKKKTSYTRSWAIYLLIVLFVLFISSTNAKFKTLTAKDANPARVAFFLGDEKFIVPFDGEELAPNETSQVIDITVSNTNGKEITEVALDYTISVEAYGSLPLKYRLYILNNNQRELIDSFSTELTYQNTLSAGEKDVQEKKYILEISWSPEDNQVSLRNQLQINRLVFTAQQKD